MPFYANLTDNMVLSPIQHYSLLSLNVIEFSIQLLLTMPISMLNFSLIFRTRILHPNLKFILLCQSASIFARSLVHSITILMRLWMDNLTWKQTPLLIFLFSYAAYFRNELAHVLVIERVRATIQFKTYEWCRQPYFTAIWFIFVNILTGVNVYGTSEASETTFMNILIWAILFVLAIIELLVIIWLGKHNDQLYCSRCVLTATLSERYQLAENIRTAKQLIPALLIHFFNITLGLAVNSGAYFRLYGPLDTTDAMFNYELINQIHTCIIAASSFLIELMMILFHPYLRRNFVEIFSRIRTTLAHGCHASNRRVTPASVSITNNHVNNDAIKNRTMSLTSIRGKEMLMLPPGSRSEADEHFKTLRIIWRVSDNKNT